MAPSSTYRHGTPLRAGVLLVNLGTPTAPTVAATRKFLREFLSDPRVVEIPRWVWWPILYGFVLPLRPLRTAHAYELIWQSYDADGSPLLIHSRSQQAMLDEHFKARGLDIVCELGMTYGEPSIKGAIERLVELNIDDLIVLPLYPQYSASTTAPVFERVAKALQGLRRMPSLSFINDYCDDDGYIRTCADHIAAYREKLGAGDKLVLSFHGLPHRALMAGDPYHCQCHKTARLIAGRLRLNDMQWSIAFQSRFGRAKWLQPYTTDVLAECARNGESVDVFTPGFSVDCLETLEEINLRARDDFIAAGGRRFHYIPALNDSAAHIKSLADVILRHARDGFGSPTDADELRESRNRALKLGAED